MNYKIISSYDNLVELLKTLPVCELVVLTATEPKMKKGGTRGVEPNPFIDSSVRKCKFANYLFGKNYVQAINENLIKEGKAPVDPNEFGEKLSWGEYEVQDKVVTYNGTRYMRCYMPEKQDSETFYLIDGEEPSEDDFKKLAPYLPTESNGSKKQEDAGLEKENQVRPLLFKFDNILSIRVVGTDDTYLLAVNPELAKLAEKQTKKRNA
jgi:hypothetical protein